MMRSIATQTGRAAAVALCLLAPPLPGVAADNADSADLSDASRILSVGGSITEIIYALGEQDRLIARDATSTYPEDALKLPDVGYMRALSPEGTLSVDPDGIIMLEGSGPAEAIDVLREADIPIVTIPETFDLDGILGKIRAVGAALGVGDKAETLALHIERDIRAVMAEAAGGERPRILFVISLQAGKIMASGTGTAADGIIRMAGAENAITGYSGYKQLTDEALVTSAPDIILTMQVDAADLATGDELRSLPAIAATPAGKAGRIISMDGAYLLGFGPRTAAAIHDLALTIRDTPKDEQ
ncbi:heme/hemin ABC transporter substrate-binding protein [Pontibaca methylaminivorans]|uniref:heme/hemin ABC transporter substrate-binding protein n=1 Tax=Pontibaca methylaminivorans TaxID=515897 RepID=UPI002FD9B479